MANSTTHEKVNTILSTLAFIVSIFSCWFSYHVYDQSKQERIIVSAGHVHENFHTRFFVSPWDVEIMVYKRFIISNLSERPISLIKTSFEFEKTDSGNEYYNGRYFGLYTDFDKPAEWPANLNSG